MLWSEFCAEFCVDAMEHFWKTKSKIHYLSLFLVIPRAVGSNLLNPIIYGVMDKRLLPFWKPCRSRKTGT